jgi:uncharacterized delta-60 repeat protein
MLEDRCVPSAGQLDPTFGSGGLVTTTLQSGTDDLANHVLVQPDGKILAVGTVQFYQYHGASGNYWEYGLARYNPNGSLDTTFGTGGIVVFNGSKSPYAPEHFALDAALQPDGKIDVIDGAPVYPAVFTVVQFTANGALDTSFGKSGQVTISFSGSGGGGARDLVIQPASAGSTEGKIVVVGSVNQQNGVMGLVRLNPGGTLDKTFGNGGIVETTIGTAGNAVSNFNVALQSNGQIVVAGQNSSGAGAVVARYNSNGSLDTSFGSGGIVSTPGYDLNAMLVQPNDGKIGLLPRQQWRRHPGAGNRYPPGLRHPDEPGRLVLHLHGDTGIRQLHAIRPGPG